MSELPVPLAEPTVVRVRPTPLVPQARSVQRALLPAVAAGSFAVGALIAGALRRRSTPARRLSLVGRRTTRGARGWQRLEIVGSRSLLVDVHLLGKAR